MYDNTIKNPNYKKVSLYLCYIITEINFCIIFLLIIIVKSKTRNIRMLKIQLSLLIIIDTISYFFYTCFAHIKRIMDLSMTDLFFKGLATIEFYIYISFIHQILNNVKASRKSKNQKLALSFNLSVIFLVIILSFNKYVKINQKIINMINYIIIFLSIILLYIYVQKKISNIRTEKYLLNQKLSYYLRFVNLISLFSLLSYNGIKLISKFFYKEQKHGIYLQIILNIFNYGMKYFVFVIFSIIIYTLNKNYNKRYILNGSIRVIKTKK